MHHSSKWAIYLLNLRFCFGFLRFVWVFLAPSWSSMPLLPVVIGSYVRPASDVPQQRLFSRLLHESTNSTCAEMIQVWALLSCRRSVGTRRSTSATRWAAQISLDWSTTCIVFFRVVMSVDTCLSVPFQRTRSPGSSPWPMPEYSSGMSFFSICWFLRPIITSVLLSRPSSAVSTWAPTLPVSPSCLSASVLRICSLSFPPSTTVLPVSP